MDATLSVRTGYLTNRAKGVARRAGRRFGEQLQDEITAFGNQRVQTLLSIYRDVSGLDLREPKLRDVQGIVGQSVVKWAESTAEGAADYAARLQRRGDDPAQALELMRAQLRTTARSGASAAHNAAVLAISRLNGEFIRGVIAVATLDSHITALCSGRHGGKWDVVTGDPLDGSTVDEEFPGRPPWHHNCRTTLVPLFVGEPDPSPEATGDEWFTSQDASDTFGDDAVEVFKRGFITKDQLIASDAFSGVGVIDSGEDGDAKFAELAKTISKSGRKGEQTRRALESDKRKVALLDSEGNVVAAMSFEEDDGEIRLERMGNLSSTPYAKKLASRLQELANESGKRAVIVSLDDVPPAVLKILKTRETVTGRIVVEPKSSTQSVDQPRRPNPTQSVDQPRTYVKRPNPTQAEIDAEEDSIEFIGGDSRADAAARAAIRDAIRVLPKGTLARLKTNGVKFQALTTEAFKSSYERAEYVGGTYSPSLREVHITTTTKFGTTIFARPTDEMTRSFIHEIGHAVDYGYDPSDPTARFTSRPEFIRALVEDRNRPEYHKELKDVHSSGSLSLRHRVNYSTKNDRETFAEVFASMHGGSTSRVAKAYSRMYPNTIDAVRKYLDEWLGETR